MNYKIFSINSEQVWQLFFTLCAVIALIGTPPEALAYVSSSAGGIASTMCKISNSLTGPIGKAVATIAVVVLGIGLFLGKLSWGLAMATAVGIGMIFSAGTIVSWLSGSQSGGTTCSS